MADKVAIMLDGGFVKKRLMEKSRHFTTVAEVVNLTGDIMGHERLKDHELFRVFYYDAPPFQGSQMNPLDKSITHYGRTQEALQNAALLNDLELQPDFAVRRGVLALRGWKLGRNALKVLERNPRPVKATDLVPNFEQKGVDLRIGLDIANYALKRVVSVLVVVSGDSDLIPALKFARKEGMKVYVHPLGGPIRNELRAHADYVFP